MAIELYKINSSKIRYEQSILPKVFKFLLNSNTEALDLTKQVGRLFQVSITLKYTEFAPYAVGFADGNDRAGPFLRLYSKFLQCGHINLGLI